MYDTAYRFDNYFGAVFYFNSFYCIVDIVMLSLLSGKFYILINIF